MADPTDSDYHGNMKENINSKRKFLPNYSDLIDRLSIVTLKSIFIPSNKVAYEQEADDIIHDLDLLSGQKNIKLNGNMIRAILVLMLSNRYIWENESLCRKGDNQDYSLLKRTHSVNGVRNTCKNLISKQLGEKLDFKVDCLAAELQSDLENWNIFKEK